MSKRELKADDVSGLLARLAELRGKAMTRTGTNHPIIVIQKAGLDGFWLHRVLQHRNDGRVVSLACTGSRPLTLLAHGCDTPARADTPALPQFDKHLMPDFDAIVIGAGAVGLAVARALALAGRETLVLEEADAFGTEISSRNSEVIHAGIYYPKDSVRARLCVEGKRLLYAYCDAHGVAHKRCGKLIVAADPSELTTIEKLAQRGADNGVNDLKMLSASEALTLEPNLRCEAALISPSTGIFDSHGYMLALLGEAEDHGASLAFNTPFVRAERKDGLYWVHAGGAEPVTVSCAALVNSAGLAASRVAEAIAIEGAYTPPTTRYAKGNYFALQGRSPFTRLIYPAPQTHGLGVHLTFDLAGQTRFGPDVEWIETIDYQVDPARCEGFADAIRRYWPGLPDNALDPAYCGVRPKLSGPAEPAADFRIDGAEVHGAEGLVQLFGIESPGLTASLAIADEVLGRLAD